MGGEFREGDGKSRAPRPCDLALAIAGHLACRYIGGGPIVSDRDFAGDPRHESRAAAFTAAVLARAPGERLTCGVESWRAAGRLLDYLASMEDDGIWANSPSASTFTAAFYLEAALRLGHDAGPAIRAAKRLSGTVHVPNQETINVYLYTLAWRAGEDWALGVARAKASALALLLRRGSLYEPWGDTPVYNAVAAWMLYNAWEASGKRLSESLDIARRLVNDIVAGLSPWGAPPLLHGRSGMFSFTVPTLAAALSLHYRAFARPEWAPQVIRDLIDYYYRIYHDAGRRILPRKNIPDETIVKEYGVREVYAAWSARALLDTCDVGSLGGEKPAAGSTASREHGSVWRQGFIGGVSVRGYNFFGNYAPPCTLALAMAGGKIFIAPPTGSSDDVEMLAPVAVGRGGPPRVVWAEARALKGSVVCGLLGRVGGRLWIRSLVVGPGWAWIRDYLYPPSKKLKMRLLVMNSEGLRVEPGYRVVGRVKTQSGTMAVLEIEGGEARISWGLLPESKPKTPISLIFRGIYEYILDRLFYKLYVSRGRVKRIDRGRLSRGTGATR